MRLVTSVALCALLPAGAFGQSAPAFRLPGKSTALLIGTDTYGASREWPRLSSPVLDATTIARSLAGDFGFDTTVVRNATKDDIVRAIVAQGKRAEASDDWSFVFIAAHGYFDDDRSQGYLVFRDSKARSDDVSRSSYLSLTELRAIVEGYRAGHVLLVIDACYGGTIDPDIRFGTDRAERNAGASRDAIESSLLRRSQYRSRLLLTSGGKEYVPDGRPGAHSPFAGALLGALREASNDGRALTFNQIVGHMADAAVEPLPRHNTFRGHEPGGDFVLIPRSFASADGARASGAPARAESPRRPDARGAVEATPARRPPMALSLLVRVEAKTEPRLTRDAEALRVSAVAAVQQAFTQRSAALHLSTLGTTSSAETSRIIAGCVARAPSGSDCIEVSVVITQTLANNRQSAQATLSATWATSKQLLTSQTGRAGPFALDVPPERVTERAVLSVMTEFVDAVLGAVRP